MADKKIKVRMTGSQRVHYKQEFEMTEKQLKEFKSELKENFNDTVGEYLDKRDIHDGEDVEDCEVFVLNKDGSVKIEIENTE